MTKKICQLYLPAFFRSYVRDSIWVIDGLLETIKKAGFSGARVRQDLRGRDRMLLCFRSR